MNQMFVINVSRVKLIVRSLFEATAPTMLNELDLRLTPPSVRIASSVFAPADVRPSPAAALPSSAVERAS